MKRASEGMMQATCGEVSSRVDSTLKLMTGLSNDGLISDTSVPVFDRAVSALPLQESYNLFMIGVTDEEGNVNSADELEPSEEKYNLMYRDYMQRLYAAGTYQMLLTKVSPFTCSAGNRRLFPIPRICRLAPRLLRCPSIPPT